MKHLSNYDLEEFKEMFQTQPLDIVEIVYEYYHRNKNYTVAAFANKKRYQYSNII